MTVGACRIASVASVTKCRSQTSAAGGPARCFGMVARFGSALCPFAVSLFRAAYAQVWGTCGQRASGKTAGSKRVRRRISDPDQRDERYCVLRQPRHGVQRARQAGRSVPADLRGQCVINHRSHRASEADQLPKDAPARRVITTLAEVEIGLSDRALRARYWRRISSRLSEVPSSDRLFVPNTCVARFLKMVSC